MGYFAQPTDGGAMPGRTAPLTPDRVQAALDSQRWHYEIDEDGDPRGSWDGHMFYFLRVGQHQQIFMVRGRWEARPSIETGVQILPVLNQWHSDHLFPKAHVVNFEDDGNARVFTEVIIDCEHGITDDQLMLHISAAITTSLDLFSELDKAFPGLQEIDSE